MDLQDMKIYLPYGDVFDYMTMQYERRGDTDRYNSLSQSDCRYIWDKDIVVFFGDSIGNIYIFDKDEPDKIVTVENYLHFSRFGNCTLDLLVFVDFGSFRRHIPTDDLLKIYNSVVKATSEEKDRRAHLVSDLREFIERQRIGDYELYTIDGGSAIEPISAGAYLLIDKSMFKSYYILYSP
jgi:hypothetical protein